MVTRPVRIALQLQPQHADFHQLRTTAAEAEDLGVDVIFNWDHFHPLDGDPAGKHFECWTMLAALAESTSRVELGPLVSCTAYRNPDLLADMARTVDHISGGRVVLGLGSGWFERDFADYGYEFGTAGSRITAFTDDLARITARFDALSPRPLRKIPVLIGGGGERRTLRLVAEHADIWHSFGDVAEVAHKREVLAAHCAAVGRDPDDIEVSAGVLGGPSPTGAPDELGAAFRGVGVSLFTVGISGPDHDLGPLRDWIAWRDEVNG